MKTPLLFPVPLLLALAGIASADMPEKASHTLYKDLWLNSPFTSPPAKNEPPPEADPFKDYSLIGISPIGDDSFRVTLIHKQSPDQRITVDSGETNSAFSILGVDHKAGDPLATSVHLKNGALTGTVRFDVKFLALAAKPAAKTTPTPPLQPGQPAATQRRGPRPRVVMPNP